MTTKFEWILNADREKQFVESQRELRVLQAEKTSWSKSQRSMEQQVSKTAGTLHKMTIH
jgi:hypothetical protein